ncbi:EamA family transporter [[Haemophilus] felis]|uniref:EamA family transporter n=1 Tax=[Haemophilus] felis TaxID=123822 RepID=A0A1T0B3B0_9PAST|nr:EamA family transporter [[Haemophilus] felis]NBI40695.1 EamA family transporter [[Haemophilus] felis]OOS04683.1 EamA family transporter [[Haemophilus] felis]
MKHQPILGFFLAFTAACMWGSLPIALQQVLQTMNAETIVWFRFLVASVGLFFLLKITNSLPRVGNFRSQHWLLLLLGVVGLSCNFFLYNIALLYIPPTTSQIFSPISSFGMLIAGVWLFKENFAKHQKIGLLLLIFGLLLFFNQKLNDFVQFNSYVKGILICLCACLIWVVYGIAQKLLLRHLSAQQILLPIYIGCCLVFLPVADFSLVLALTPFQLACLLFCCLNTLIGYGCYAEALNRWNITKVSVVVTQIPILTLIFSEILHFFAPDTFMYENLNSLSYLGALTVVSGALLSAIGHKFIKVKKQ